MDFYLLGKQHQTELIKQAEQERLAREIQASQRPHRPAVEWVGRKLTTIGNQLITSAGGRS